MNIRELSHPFQYIIGRLKADFTPNPLSINVDTKMQGGRGCFKRVDRVTRL